jgi:hypothetical protein
MVRRNSHFAPIRNIHSIELGVVPTTSWLGHTAISLLTDDSIPLSRQISIVRMVKLAQT